MKKKRIAVFASGSGTNAQKIFEHFQNSYIAEIGCVLSNKPDALVLDRANKFKIPSFVFNRNQFYNSDDVLNVLIEKKIEIIVLAGFLWLVPENLLSQFSNRIINIHPALLPKYGGKGMYGAIVHETIVKNKEKESGITIHFANTHFDEGEIIFQAKCKIEIDDTPEIVARKVQMLEHQFYPEIIEKVVKNL